MRIDPVPQPPLLDSHWMMLLEAGLLGLAATGVFHGLGAWNRPVPPPTWPELLEDEEEEDEEEEEELVPLPELDDEEEEDDDEEEEVVPELELEVELDEEPAPASGQRFHGCLETPSEQWVLYHSVSSSGEAVVSSRPAQASGAARAASGSAAMTRDLRFMMVS